MAARARRQLLADLGPMARRHPNDHAESGRLRLLESTLPIPRREAAHGECRGGTTENHPLGGDRAHKAKLRARLAQICTQMGARESRLLADQLFLLMEGASHYPDAGVRGPARNVARAAKMLIDAHLRASDPQKTRKYRACNSRSDRRPCGIEMQRQEREKESGVAVACGWALGKLYNCSRARGTVGNKPEARLRGNIEPQLCDRAARERLGLRAMAPRATGHGTSRNPGGLLKKEPLEPTSEAMNRRIPGYSVGASDDEMPMRPAPARRSGS